MSIDTSPQQGLKGQLYKEIGKQIIQQEGELVFVPRAQSCFLSDDFGNLPRAAQLHELGVHQITSSANQFTPHTYDFTDLYESFIAEGGFELQGKSQEQIRDYIQRMAEKRKKVDPETLKLMDRFEDLQDEYDDLDEDEREDKKGKKISRKLLGVQKLLRDKQVESILQDSGDKDPDIERLRKAIRKFLIHKKSYEVDPRAGEARTWDEDTYVDVDLTPGNFASMLKTNSKGVNNSDKYEEFTTSVKKLRESASEESTSWNASLDISYSGVGVSGDVSSTNNQCCSESSLGKLDIGMKLTSIWVTRKWFDVQLFQNERIGSKGDKKGSWSSQRCPYLIEAVVVAKDVEIEGIQMSNQEKQQAKSLSANAKVSVLGFGGASAGYSSSSSSTSSSFDYEKGTYKCKAPHIVGYLCRPFPKFPHNDSQTDMQAPCKTTEQRKQDCNKKFGSLKGVEHLDQKKTNFCVRAAIATAVAAQVPIRTQQQVFLDQKTLYRTLIGKDSIKASDNTPDLSEKLKRMEEGTDPKNFNMTYLFAFDKYDTPYKIKLLVRELAPEMCPQNDEDGSKYLLGYDVYTQQGQIQSNGFTDFHCVAVDEIQQGQIIGFNSWGSLQQKPRMNIDGPFVTIWQILVQEVKELDVCIEENERENFATDLPQATIDLFDNSRETQNESFLSLFGAACQPDVQMEAGQIDSSSKGKISGKKRSIESITNTKMYQDSDPSKKKFEGNESHLETDRTLQSRQEQQDHEMDQDQQLEVLKQSDLDPTMDYDLQVQEMQKQNHELVLYLKETINGTDIRDTLKPYTQAQTNPVTSYRQMQIATPKPNSFAQKTTGHSVALLIHEGCGRWDQNILRFLTALAEMQGTIKAIKLDVENLQTRLKFLKRRGNFVSNKDFETQFDSLNQSVTNFKVILDKITTINNSCQVEINGSTQDIHEMDDNTKKIESQKKQLHEQLHTLQVQVFGLSADLTQCIKLTEDNEKSVNQSKIEVNKLLDEECIELAKKIKIESQQSSITQEMKNLQTEIDAYEQEIIQVDTSITTWKGHRNSIEEGPDKIEAEKVYESEQKGLLSQWAQKLSNFRKKVQGLIENKGEVSAPKGTHFTFLCDSSSSVSDQDYKQMIQAISNLINSRKKLAQASMDTYSLILFTNQVYQVELNMSIQKDFRAPPRQHGGTDFNVAFKECLNVVQANKLSNQVIVFMTDGDGPYNKVEGLFNSQVFYDCYRKWSSLKLFCVGYGNSYDNKALEAICKTANGGQLQCILPDLAINYIHYARDRDSLLVTYDQINNQVAAHEAHLQKQIDANNIVICEMEKQKEQEISNLQKQIDCQKNIGATSKNEQLKYCDLQLKRLGENKERIKESLKDLRTKKDEREITHNQYKAQVETLKPKIDAMAKKRLEAVENLNAYQVQLEAQKKKITDLRSKQAMKAIEQAELTQENINNAKLFEAHNDLQGTQRSIMIFIHQFQIQAKLIDQAIRNASYYITENAFFDQDKAVQLCMTKLASIYGVQVDQDKIKWQYQEFFVEVLEKIFDKKKPTDDDKEIASFLGKHFQIQEFIHQQLGQIVPGKVNRQANDDDSDDDTIIDRAKIHFGANAVQKWRRQKKTLDRNIERIESQKEKQEEKIDKEEERSKPNKNKLEGLRELFDEHKISLRKYEKELKILDGQEDKAIEQAEAGKAKVVNFKNQFKQLERAIIQDAVEAMTKQSLDNVELNLGTFAHGVIRNLQAMEQAIPKIINILKDGQPTDS